MPSGPAGALLSASLKLRVNSRWNERTGVRGIGVWYSDTALMAAGGDRDGTLDLRQYQYYPENAYGAEDSPFLHTESALRLLHRQTSTKPAIAGEFPLLGLVQATHNPTAMSLREAYEALWHGGYSGGYTCAPRPLLAPRYHATVPSTCPAHCL